MKKGNLSRILAAFLLIVSLMSVTAFGVNAADIPDRISIVGWEQWSYDDEVTEEAISKVTVNGTELPKEGTLEFGLGETVMVQVFLKDGFRVSMYLDGVGMVLADPGNSPYDDGDINSPTAEFELPDEEFLSNPNFTECAVLHLIIPVEEDGDVINSVDLDIKALKAGTVVTADYDTELGYDWDSQDPNPDISIPADADYELDTGEEDEYLDSYWVEAPVEDYGTYIYVNDEDKPCVEPGETLYAEVYLRAKEGFYFSQTLTVNVTGGEFTGIIEISEEGQYAWLILSTKVEEEVPDTGDEWSAIWLIISASSAAALAGVMFLRKKLQ